MAYNEKAYELKAIMQGKLPDNWQPILPNYSFTEPVSTRDASGKVLNEIAKKIPFFIGGSADLSGSTKTMIEQERDFHPNSYDGRNIWFGVREFAMGAALNGMASHSGMKVFGGTFFLYFRTICVLLFGQRL